MKKTFFYIMTVAVAMTTACDANFDAGPEFNAGQNQITMITKKSNVTIEIGGPGTITIDWGDKVIETDNILNPGYGGQQTYSHTYSGASAHTIKITGDNIERLVCGENGITNLDVSRNPALTSLHFYMNPLKSLDLRNNFALTFLNCSANELTELDLSKNTELTFLSCVQNQLTKLDLSNNTELGRVYCQCNKLTSDALNAMLSTLNDNFIWRKELYIAFNPGTYDCDISIAEDKGWIAVDYVDYKSVDLNNLMTMTTQQSDVNIMVAGTGAMTIDWGDETDIKRYPVYYTYTDFTHAYSGFSTTNIVKITSNNITYLNCFQNELSNLDVSGNPELLYLFCGLNPLKSLDVSSNPALLSLGCQVTELTDLDVSKNTELISLGCIRNQLTKIDLSNNTKLQYIYCQGNKLSSDALNAMFETLHDNIIPGQTKELYIAFNPGTNDCNISIAEKKGWSVNLVN